MKIATIILTMLMVVFNFTNVDASGKDATSIIYNLINENTTVDKSGSDIIYSILKKEKDIKIKVVTDEKELEDEPKSKNMNDYIKGVDISKWNGSVNWNSLKENNVKFVIIRAGYGTTVDYMFHKNIQNAIDNDMQIGIYWFSYAYTNDMAIREANKCNETISKYKKNISLPIFYDFEYDSVKYALRQGYAISKDKASSMAESFCDRIKYHKYETGIYTNIDYANRYFHHETLDKYHTWIAQWSNVCTYKRNYIMWQVSDRYYVDDKRFDLNYFYFNRYEK